MFATATGQREALMPVVLGDTILYRFPRVFRIDRMRPDPAADHRPHFPVRLDVALHREIVGYPALALAPLRERSQSVQKAVNRLPPRIVRAVFVGAFVSLL